MSAPSPFPYDDLPEERSWSRAVRDIDPAQFDPQGSAKFLLARDARVASAGSCFAIRVAEALRTYGFNYLAAESGGAMLPREIATRFGYWPLSARYGNVYTTLQLVQLFERAFGIFEPTELPWRSASGFVDPFRPRIQPQPFASIAELDADRAAHLAAVRTMFATLDAFIFTLGLTEVWTSRDDGAAFPACPGRGFGEFDPARYVLRNLDVEATAAALARFVEHLARVNPAARVILTVSPVPIAATMEAMHVARASMYTKSILIVAAETIARRYAHVDYFASYETVMYAPVGDAFAKDRRHIAEPYVRRVVASLFNHYFDVDIASLTAKELEAEPYVKPCDEDELARLIDADSRRR